MRYKALHKLTYGLYIITTRYDEKPAGYIANTAFQITSSPPQIAISCNKKNSTAEKILQSKIFSLSVLKKETNTSIIGTFGFMSGSEVNKFENVQTITAKTGAPIVLDSSVAWFDCRVKDTLDVGTHILIIGSVADSDIISDDDPLTYRYYRNKYKMLSPENAPTYIDKNILESESKKEEKAGDQIIKPADSDIYTCSICGFTYNPEEGDPSSGIPGGTPFNDLPDDYKCPICNAGKDYFNR